MRRGITRSRLALEHRLLARLDDLRVDLDVHGGGREADGQAEGRGLGGSSRGVLGLASGDDNQFSSWPLSVRNILYWDLIIRSIFTAFTKRH